MRLYHGDTIMNQGEVLNELALFAGAGGGILGGKLLGWRTVCAVEIDRYAASVLCARQNEKVLETFPIWDDVRSFDGRPWRGIVDVISGGFPCQDISASGRGKGIEGERSGLWKEFARIVAEVGPSFIFVENSPMLRSRGLGVVLGDLAALGYNAKWGVLGAAHAGAPHHRERIWILAYSDKTRCLRKLVDVRPPQLGEGKKSARGDGASLPTKPLRGGSVVRYNPAQTVTIEDGDDANGAHGFGRSWFKTEPRLDRVAHGMADRVDRLEAIGNGQVPAVAALAWQILSNGVVP